LIRTPLLSVLLVSSDHFHRVFLLVGFTSTDQLTTAGGDLLADVDSQSALFCGPNCPTQAQPAPQAQPVPGGTP
jgi:hypothetical protein